MAGLTQDWNATRLILEDHQHWGNQISGGCTCGYNGYAVTDWLDHLTNVLLGCVEDGE